MGLTLFEKIIANHCDQDVKPGAMVDMQVDVRAARDFAGANVVNIENGEVTAPVNVMRFDESIYRVRGSNLVGLTKERDSEKPFFMTVWTHEPHLPIESAPEFMEPYKLLEDEGLRQHHGNITQLDDACGILMKGLDELGLRENTVVFFTSDNGPEGRTGDRGRTRGRQGKTHRCADRERPWITRGRRLRDCLRSRA